MGGADADTHCATDDPDVPPSTCDDCGKGCGDCAVGAPPPAAGQLSALLLVALAVLGRWRSRRLSAPAPRRTAANKTPPGGSAKPGRRK